MRFPVKFVRDCHYYAFSIEHIFILNVVGLLGFEAKGWQNLWRWAGNVDY